MTIDTRVDEKKVEAELMAWWKDRVPPPPNYVPPTTQESTIWFNAYKHGVAAERARQAKIRRTNSVKRAARRIKLDGRR